MEISPQAIGGGETPSASPARTENALKVAWMICLATGWLAIAVGLAVIIGWLVDSAWLKGAIGVPITMKANTALCFALAGASLLLVSRPDLRWRRAGQALGAVLAVLAGLTLSQHIIGWDLGMDQFLFREPLGQPGTASPGRMGVPASLSFLFLGLGLALIDWRNSGGQFPIRYFPLAATVISLVTIVGYVFGSTALYSNPPVMGIAWPTAATLFLVSLGVLAARPQNLIVEVLCAPDAGGMAARRLIIPALAIPFLLLLLYGESRDRGLIEAAAGRGILAVVMMTTLGATVLFTARRLSLTSEKQARVERQLRRSERELADFFENAAVGLHWIGPDGIILRANKADMDLLGYQSHEYVGHPIAEFYVDRQVIDDILRRITAGESLRDHPAQLRAKDGTIKEVLIDSSALWEDGRLVHTQCFTRDATERRRAEIIGGRLSAIVESSSDAIVGKDLNGIVTSWNGGAERMFGYTREEMVGRSIMALIPSDRTDEEHRILESIRRGEKVENYESVRRRKSGELLDVSLSISPILDAHGRVVGASKIARDISDQKRIESEREELLSSERAARGEAERSARIRDEFLAVISHELRTPLNGILGWSQYLNAREIEDHELREGIEAIERGARTQAQLIEDLLDMNRITTGRLTLNVRPVELSGVIEAAMATIRPAAETKGIRLHTAAARGIGPVLGDPIRLQQVVWNLLSNAVKFTPRGGEVNVHLRRVDSQVEIGVSDTGMGIDPRFLPHVFERFTQADSSTTRAHGGLGLGLSIVKHLVELHGGTVRAKSDGEGQGATFLVHLPLSAVEEDRRQPPWARLPAPAELAAVDLADVRVLVVDDDPETRELIRRILERSKAEVITAASGAEALEILGSRKLDVLVSDIGMPQMDGYQFIRKVRESVAIPAVALTAYARSSDRTRAMLAGYQMHIAKPIEPQELLATVASFAGRT
jgi:PAS domain S-box-containing protein